MRRRRVILWLGAALVLMIGIAAATGGSSPQSAPRLPGGRWGRLIACLEDHPTFKVYDATNRAVQPSVHTNALDVWQDFTGTDLAYVGDNALGADDQTGAGAANVRFVVGPIHYGFEPQANARNKRDVRACVRRAYHVPIARRLRRGRAHPGSLNGYTGLGAERRMFVRANHGPPPNPAAVPGLAWYTVDSVNAAGRVLSYDVTENFKPPAGDRERISLLLGIMLPGDISGTRFNNDTCIVVRSLTLKRLTGLEYAAATTITGTAMAHMQAENSPTC